jgi:hypothetical protein
MKSNPTDFFLQNQTKTNSVYQESGSYGFLFKPAEKK